MPVAPVSLDWNEENQWSDEERLEKGLINWDTMEARELIQAFMAQKNAFELKEFLDDILTKSELEKCISRMTAVSLIWMNAPYSFIQKETGQSSATIARLSKNTYTHRGGFGRTMQKLNPNKNRYFGYRISE